VYDLREGEKIIEVLQRKAGPWPGRRARARQRAGTDRGELGRGAGL